MSRKKPAHHKRKTPPRPQMQVAPSLEARLAERQRSGRDTATIERMRKADEAEVGDLGTQRIIDAPLERLRKKLAEKENDINPALLQAGERFRDDGVRALQNPGPPSVDWGSVGGNFGPRVPGEFRSQAIHDACARYRAAKAAIGKLSIIAEALLVKELSFEDVGLKFGHWRNRRDANTAGQTALIVVLQMLASYYERRRAA